MRVRIVSSGAGTGYLTYQIRIPQDCDCGAKTLQNLKQLEEEEPLLHIVWNERLGEILTRS